MQVTPPPISVSIPLDPFSKIRLIDSDFNSRIQDTGCLELSRGKKSYKNKKIPSYGPKEQPTYYYGLSSIAIDYMDSFRELKDSEAGWPRVPKNATNVMVKIIELLLKFRKMDDDGKFILSQE